MTTAEQIPQAGNPEQKRQASTRQDAVQHRVKLSDARRHSHPQPTRALLVDTQAESSTRAQATGPSVRAMQWAQEELLPGWPRKRKTNQIAWGTKTLKAAHLR